MFQTYNWGVDAKLQKMVSKKDEEFKTFVNNFYDQTEQTDFLFKNSKNIDIVLPFSVISMFEFLLFTVLNESVYIPNSKKLRDLVRKDGTLTVSEDPIVDVNTHFLSDTKFNPHLFHSLYVYSNIVQPVDYNDQQFKLLDIIFLKPHFENENSVIEHRGIQFKVVDVDTVSEIRISIMTALGQPAPFIHGPVFVVLQFQDFQHV